MAKYTVELGSMLSAYVSLLPYEDNDKEIEIKTINEGIFVYKKNDFLFNVLNNPVRLVNDFSNDFILSKVGQQNFNPTDNQEINKNLLNDFFRAFVSEFYEREISRENPLNWWRLVYNYLIKYLPIHEQNIKNLIIDKSQWITNLSKQEQNATFNNVSSGKGKSNSIGAGADTPQDQLEFNIETDEPVKSYKFDYASSVTGSADASSSSSQSNGQNNTLANTTQRNATIVALMTELNSLSNGAYGFMFDKANDDGLFLGIN